MATAQKSKNPGQSGTRAQAAKREGPRAGPQPKTGTRTGAGSSASARRRPGTNAERRSSNAEHGAAVPIPVVTPHMKIYKLHVPGPGVHEVVVAGRSAAAHLPPAERLAFYGGLGAAAVLGVISWPVATAVGLGTVIARRARGADRAKTAQTERTEQTG